MAHWRHRNTKCARGGFTTAEGITMVLTLVVGAGIGVAYLRGDLNTVLGAQTEAEAETEQPAGPDPVELQRRIEQLEREVARLTDWADEGTAEKPGRLLEGLVSQPAPAWESLNEQEQEARRAAGDASLAYWNQVQQAVAQEQTLLRANAPALAGGNAETLVAFREKGANLLAAALAKLKPGAEVDPAVVKYTRQLQNWYADGGTLYAQANFLLREGTLSMQHGRTGKEWTEAEVLHTQARERLVRQEEALRLYLSETYRVEYPPLG
ncbi:MAG: hypothetical protein WDZ59_03590 [Pirellulales bacterium]